MTQIDLVIEGRAKDLGGFGVRRTLPSAKRRMVGPFIFWDEMGPGRFAPGKGIDVRPHPHIGLSTVTWLFEGELTHNDSTGARQSIQPGDVNWMIAGRGIVHSERTGDEPRAAGHAIHGIQAWVAAPRSAEEVEPSFHHVPAAQLPVLERPGVSGVLIAGDAYGLNSPVPVQSPLFYLAIDLEAGAELELPSAHAERAIYPVSGAVDAGGQRCEPGSVVIFGGGEARVKAVDGPARLMAFGGAPLEGERFIDWNFVASSKDKLEQAKRDWTDAPNQGWSGRFGMPAGENEFIPHPDAEAET